MLLDGCRNVGLPGAAGMGVENSGMKIAAQTMGKAPVNSGTVTTVLPDGHAAVVAALVSVITLNDGLFGSTLQHFFCWFCLWP